MNWSTIIVTYGPTGIPCNLHPNGLGSAYGPKIYQLVPALRGVLGRTDLCLPTNLRPAKTVSGDGLAGRSATSSLEFCNH